MPHPDPVLTANLYSNRGLDGVVHGVVAPFRARLAERDPDGEWSLWWVRYSRGGEHLKLRLHGPERGRELARELLAQAAEAHFAALPPADPELPRVSRPDAPAVDVEDEAAEDRPDRTLLWTQYRRSHVNLGPPVYLRHDGYVERFTACLAAGAELVLEQLQPDAEGKVTGAARQRVLLRGVFTGLGALGFSAGQRAAYLAYHRDWLLRFSLSDTEKETALREHFDRRVDGLAAIVEQLRRASTTEWEAGAAPASGVEGRWRAAIAALMAWLEPFRGDPEYLTDPFTDDAAFPAVFKVFHALANHLGVGMLDESFTHHLLLRVATPAPAEPVAELAGVG